MPEQHPIRLPPLWRVRQAFDRSRLDHVERALREKLDQSELPCSKGERIALAVGSRGIDRLPEMVGVLVDWVRSRGGEPFIVPAMGSHGGATAEGQTAVLHGYGVTEEAVGAPIQATMDVVELSRGDASVPVYMDRLAHEADGVILLNRVKVHTSFHGPYESGLMKMAAIGLGKQSQAAELHRLGVRGLRDVMPQVARAVLASGKVRGGVAVVENAYDEICRLEVLSAAEIPEQEGELLDLARTTLPRLPVEDLDILVVDEIGKNISGVGMDPNVIGRLMASGEPEPESPRIRMIAALDLTPETHGNALGMGLADIVTLRLFQQIDFAATYENAWTTTFLARARVPVIAATDLDAVAFALRGCGDPLPDALRLMRIRNTMRLDELHVSPALANELRGHPAVEVLDEVSETFDSEGKLPDFERQTVN